ncbi:uncharacterized protein MONOS_12576 [Monocercomonoides exilis]|uniref:uncharacterized protein n=1 Tax=Monocercomonoides exilis TaxID=2049356 RepID=UPI0035597063|nr:hypothetical protein MONOS_12576 [Monocercomonoides exilis]|eukprot:MONOS_12576.1-p1 / transcript=MONOS_12576.1 / gene=MONOS_12576 / organism=Monocercomonoides_exilis_PA203 / gene_product=unspecified product / transcript_product=unspecified product / location=Mono_scaffold00704:24476-25318(-) / protein_length=281 / sequence_SO=supercontig / SO=protein_coding / is_pseudo=false
MSTIFVGTGLATEPCAAPLTGGSPSAIPAIAGSYSASQSSVQSELDGRIDPTRSEEDKGGFSIQQTFIKIFGQPPEVSLYDMHLPENKINEALSLMKNEDLSPFIQNAPPPFTKSKVFWKDALDRAGERTETYLYPAIKLLISACSTIKSGDTTKEMIADSCLLLAQALKEARHVKIQARYGFSEAEKMKDEFSSSLLTQRQKDILEESKKTSTKLRWGSASITNSYARKKQIRGMQSGTKNYRFLRDLPRTTSTKRSFITSSAPRGYSRGSSGDKAKSQ